LDAIVINGDANGSSKKQAYSKKKAMFFTAIIAVCAILVAVATVVSYCKSKSSNSGRYSPTGKNNHGLNEQLNGYEEHVNPTFTPHSPFDSDDGDDLVFLK